MKLLLSLIAALPALAAAHEGHGMPGASHWHADDLFLFLVAAALVAGLWSKFKK